MMWNGGVVNFAATKALVDANNDVFTIGELNSVNTLVTDTFEEWVETVFNRCVFEILVFVCGKCTWDVAFI